MRPRLRQLGVHAVVQLVKDAGDPDEQRGPQGLPRIHSLSMSINHQPN